MPRAAQVTRGVLAHMAADFSGPAPGGHRAPLQFNPETVKVTSANQLDQGKPETGTSPQKPPGEAFVAPGSTKLTMQLVFDATAPPLSEDGVRDVREATERVRFFIVPTRPESGGAFHPPAVRFTWGAFTFDGTMDSYDETFEVWSPDGRPLRASVSVGLSRKDVSLRDLAPSGGGGPGARPLTAAPAGVSLQALAEAAGRGGDWARIATANGIENPRLVTAGALLDLGTGVRAGAGVGVGVGVGVRVGR